MAARRRAYPTELLILAWQGSLPKGDLIACDLGQAIQPLWVLGSLLSKLGCWQDQSWRKGKSPRSLTTSTQSKDHWVRCSRIPYCPRRPPLHGRVSTLPAFSMLRCRLFQSGYWGSFKVEPSSILFQVFLLISSLASLPLNQHLLYTFLSWQSSSNTATELSAEAASLRHNPSGGCLPQSCPDHSALS